MSTKTIDRITVSEKGLCYYSIGKALGLDSSRPVLVRMSKVHLLDKGRYQGEVEQLQYPKSTFEGTNVST